jgi:MFS family permease
MFADLRVLRERPFRRLFLSQTVSLLGTAIAPIALAFAILGEPHGSASELGFALAGRAVGQVTFLLAGGVLADRLPRFRLMTVSNLLACAAQAGIATMFIVHAAPLPAIIVLSVVNGSAGALFLPASRGIIPQLVPTELMQPANALMRLSRNSTSIIGTAMGGVIVATIGAGWGLAFDAASYAAAATLILGMRAGPAARAASSIITDLRDGWREFRSRSWVWLIVAQFAFVNGCLSVFMVLGPVLARQYLGGAPGWATIMTAESVGLVGGSLVAMRLRPAFPLRVAAAATFGFLPPFFLLAFRAPLWLLVTAMLATGVCVDIFEVLWDTSLQNHVPNEALSRIASYDMLGSFVLGPACLVLVGPLADAIGVRATLLGASVLLTLATVVPLLTRAVRTLPATRPAAAAVPPTPAVPAPPASAAPPRATPAPESPGS